MMPCPEFRSLWTEWRDNRLSEIESVRLHNHLEACLACRRYDHDMSALVDTLRGLPEPPAPSEQVVTRLIANAKTSAMRKRNSFQRFGMAASLLVSFVAGALFWALIGNPLTNETLVTATAQPVELRLSEAQTVRLMLDAKRSIETVTFTVRLPAGVELEGYPGQRSLSWEGRLQAGLNSLALPLIARIDTNSSATPNPITGHLIAKIEYSGKQQALSVPLRLPFNKNQAGRKTPGSPGNPNVVTSTPVLSGDLPAA